MTSSVAIIIPLYKTEYTRFEEISMKQCFTVLSEHKIIVVKPHSLSLENYTMFHFDEVVSFDEHYFASIAGYNMLMLSAHFYAKFLAYKHILIYQTDAFVFKDELSSWCNKGYDYIGAPWLVNYPDIFKKIKNKSTAFLHTKMNLKQAGTDLPTRVQFDNKVGNGGLSLRNTEKFFDICLEEKSIIEYYNNNTEHYFNEDAFWGVEVNRKSKRLNIPLYRVAAYFSIENHPQTAFKLTGGKLPFGCHAWEQHLDFWIPVFAKAGIDLKVGLP